MRIWRAVFLRGLGFWCLGVSPVLAQAPDDGTGAAVELAHRWAEGVGGNHAELLEGILDESYEHIHGTGLVESRGQFLEALRSGTRKYQPLRLEGVKSRSFGEVVLVTGQFALKVEVRGKVLEGVNRFGMTIVRRPAGWRLVQFQATAVAPAKAVAESKQP